jgi:hypothetical protein
MLHVLQRRGGPAMASAVITATVMAVVLAACGSGPAAQVATPARSSTTAAAAAAAVGGSSRPYQLYTHCGIDEARIGNRYFEAVHPLSDGSGNPPPGWGNPYQQGTITLVSASEAVFRDHAGHQLRFRLRPGATRFKHLCS